jgi:hypothetical protein
MTTWIVRINDNKTWEFFVQESAQEFIDWYISHKTDLNSVFLEEWNEKKILNKLDKIGDKNEII